MSDAEPPGDRSGGGAHRLIVPSAPSSVPLVRRYAVDICVALGWADAADNVALLASEVATNAVLHAYGPEVCVRVRAHGPRLRVEVVDGSPVLPIPRGAHAGDEGGRGLHLVEALAVAWGVDRWGDGKTFWFEVGL